jgi:two-component system response regulator DegU
MNKIIKLAVVDDSSFFRTGLVDLLQTNKKLQIVIECSNGQELIDILKLGKHKPHIILLDLEMPVMDGMETMEYLSKHHPEIKVLILTVHDEARALLNLIERGVNGFLMKDDINELINAIDTIYKQEFYFKGWDMKKIAAAYKKDKNKPASKNQVNFTKRELEVLTLICKGLTNKEISSKLNIGVRTVDRHKDNILQKVNVRNTVELVIYVLQNDLIRISHGKK